MFGNLFTISNTALNSASNVFLNGKSSNPAKPLLVWGQGKGGILGEALILRETCTYITSHLG